MIKSEIDWEFSVETLQYIVSRIIERDSDREGEMNNEFNKGRHLAYWEILDMIKNDLEVRGFDIKDFGYDEDFDKKLDI